MTSDTTKLSITGLRSQMDECAIAIRDIPVSDVRTRLALLLTAELMWALCKVLSPPDDDDELTVAARDTAARLYNALATR